MQMSLDKQYFRVCTGRLLFKLKIASPTQRGVPIVAKAEIIPGVLPRVSVQNMERCGL